ncbi:MAG TPA: YfhO family protein, partial [Thermoanaerobaculia bacterium]|nr:YfhO family protein [Thermoanaerobaculia bacterium]
TAGGAVLLVAAVLVPRALLFAGWVPATSSLLFYPPVPATDFVAARLAEAGARGFRVAGIIAALPPHAAAFFGFPEVRAYDPMTFAPYHRFLELAGDPVDVGWSPIHDPSLPVLDFLGARWIFDHPHRGERAGVEVVYRGPEAVVYDNPGALPRLYVPRAVEVRPSHEEALATAGELPDFAERVAASGDLPVPPGTRPRVPNGPARVDALRVEPRRIVADVTVDSLALLATSQPAIPGWRAEIDGEPAGFVRVNGAFLGLLVDTGHHHVELRYAPASWTVGLLLFLLGTVLATWAAWRPSRRLQPTGEGARAAARSRQ